MTAGEYIKLTKTNNGVRAIVERALITISNLGSMPRKMLKYTISEEVAIRKEEKNEISANVGIRIEKYRASYDPEHKKWLYLDEEPFLSASFKIKRIEEYDEKNKVKSYPYTIKYIVGPLYLSVWEGRKYDFVEEIPINIKKPEEFYTSLEDIIDCAESKRGLECANRLEDIVEIPIKAIEESEQCKSSSYCIELIGAFWKSRWLYSL